MQTKFFLILFGVSLGLIVLGSIIGSVLESSGVLTKENLGSRGVAVVLGAFFALFCVAAFSLVPIILKVFIRLQIRIGNADLVLIRWLRENEQAVVWGFWGLCATGLLLVLFLQGKEILKQIR